MLFAAPSQAQKTLMIMVDYFGQREQTDTIIGMNVYQPPTEITYLPGGAPPRPVLTNLYETEKLGWWYSLPNFSVDDYAMGRIRINTNYQRGWYQWDLDKYMSVGDTFVFPDTLKSFTYQVIKTGVNVTVTLDTTLPKIFVFPDSARFKAPKLYLTQGNSESPLLNQRPTTGLGNIDKCMDSIPGDTVWMRFGDIGSLPPQGPTATSLRCTGYNPYSKRAALVYLRNPWPGADQPVVEFNGQNVPLYPSTNPDWLVADLRYLAPLGTPSGQIRFKKAPSSSVYFDSAGVEQGIVAPFTLPALSGGSYYYVPPEAGAPAVVGTGAPPAPKYTIFVQNPWKPGSPRLLWESDKNYHVMRPTQSCGWFRYPLYAAPKKVLIWHSFEDSSYGTKGAQFRTVDNWVDITPAMINAKGEVYIQTFTGTTRTPAAVTTAPSLKDCSTDTLKLVMEAFDFQPYGLPSGNPSFQVGGVGDLMGTAGSTGLVKGMVQKNLGVNGLPVWTGRDSGYQKGGIVKNGGKSTPTNWFDTLALKAAVPGIEIGHGCVELPLAKGPTDNGYYKFVDTSFFPLDTIRDRRGYSELLASDAAKHNFLFCMHGHAAFEFTPGLKFDFKGDDDVWVFINKKLAVDLGGTHAPVAASVDLDKLKLREGMVYPFDIFYCERQTNGSSILISTTMDLQPSWKYRAIPSIVGSVIKVPIEGQKSSNYTPSCADLTNGKVLPWVQTDGRMVVVGPDGSDLNEVYLSDVSLYGGNLSYAAGTIQLDTTKLKQEMELKWPGKYTIRIESRLGDSLYSIAFTKTYGAVNVTGTVLDMNGDGVADSMRLSAPRLILADDPSYHLAWFTAAGAKDSVLPTVAQVRKITDSSAMAPLAGKAWGQRTQIPAGVRVDSMNAILTHPDGLLMAIVNPIKLIDGIAPVADSAFLKYDESGTGADSLFVWASEPMSKSTLAPAALAGWALLGSSNAARLVSGDAASLGNGARFVLVFDPAANPVAGGDSLRLGGWAADALRNAPGARSKWVLVQTNPVAKGWMLDKNGDGAPDSVGLSSKGDLSKTDSVRIQWKTASGLDTIVSVKTATGIGTGIALPANILGGATFCQGCRIELFEAGLSRKFPLADSVPAIAVKASYRYGTVTDTLVVTTSEVVAAGSKLGEAWFAQKAAGAGAYGSGTLIVGTAPNLATAKVVKLLVASGSVTGDSLRLRGWALDQFANAPGAVSPFVTIEFGPQPIRTAVWDRNGDGTVDSVVYRLTRSANGVRQPDGFGLVWAGKAVTVAGLVRSADGLTWSGAVSGALPLATASNAADAGWLVFGTDVTSFKSTVDDSVAPVAIDSAMYRFGPASGPDTLFVTASENIAKLGASLVATKAGAIFGSATDLVQVNKLVLLINPAAWTGADSVRLAVSAKDASGNGPGASSRLVEVVYGNQPIRTVVWDRDGDGFIDSVAYRLTRGASGVGAPDGFGLIWSGTPATVGTLPRSTDGSSWTGSVTVSGSVPVTSPATDDAGWLVLGTDKSSYKSKVVDSVAPVARNARLIYGFENGAPDTVVVDGSEDIALGGGAWLMLGKDSASASPTLLTSAQASNANPASGIRLTMVVPAGSIGGDMGWVRFGPGVSDGKVAVGASSRWAPLVVTPSGRAYLFDSDGDGTADQMKVAVKGSLATAVSAKLKWSDASGNSATKDWPIAPAAGSFEVRPSADKWFAKGATSCPGACVATFYDVAGNPLVSWNLIDSVAPMLMRGTYRFGAARDTLRVEFSEDLTSVNAAGAWLEWGGPAVGGPVVHAAIAPSGDKAELLIEAANGATSGWDSLRLAAGSRSGAATDAGGVKTGATSPWAPVEYGLPPMLAKITDPRGEGRGTDVEIRLARTVPAAAASGLANFVLNWTNASGNGVDTRTVAAGSLAFADGAWIGPLAEPFALGATGPVAGCGAVASKGTEQRSLDLVDGIPPSLIWAKYRFSLPSVAADTVVVGLSEPWEGGALGDPSNAFALVGTVADAQALAPWKTWQLSSDKLQLTMVVDTAWGSQLGSNDSARLAQGSRVVDAAANKVGANSRWVKIAFGLRPVQLDIAPYPNPVLRNTAKDGGETWKEPGVGIPAIELLVRDPFDVKSGWKRAETVVSGDAATGSGSLNPENHLLGIKIRLNRPLEGTLIIYDNLGVAVRQVDLGVLAKLWTANEASKDDMRDVWVAWNGTDAHGKFAASGIYLFRAVVKFEDEGKLVFRNLVWKLGWHRDTK